MRIGCRSRRAAMQRVIWCAPVVLFGACSTSPSPAAQLSSTWKPNTTGNWNVNGNWLGAPNFPNNGGGNTYNALITDVNARVTLNVPITIDNFTMSAGTLNTTVGGATLTILQSGTWNGGNISGNGTININGATFTIGGADKGLSRFTFNTALGTTTRWTGGAIGNIDTEGGTFNNSGTFIDSTDAGWFWNSLQTPVFNNRAGARYIKSAGSGGFNKEVEAAFNNAGTVDVQAARLWLDGGGVSTGTFQVASGAMLRISDFNEGFSGGGAPITTMSSTSVVNSSGLVEFANFLGGANTDINGKFDSAEVVIDAGATGQVRFNTGARVGESFAGNWTVNSGAVLFNTGQATGFVHLNDLTLNGGEISGTDGRVVDGFFSWTGGAFTLGDTFIENGATLDGGLHVMQDANVINQNVTTVWLAGDVSMQSAGFYNDSVLDIQFDATAFNNTPAFEASFINSGLLMKSGGTGVTNLDNIDMFNAGTIDVQTGTLRLGGGGAQDGTFLVSNGATLELGATNFTGSGFFSPHVFHSGARISGAGGSTLHITGQTTFDAGSRLQIDHLIVEAPLINNTATFSAITSDIQNGGAVSMNGGTFNTTGALNIASVGTGTLSVASAGKVTSQTGFIGLGVGSNGTVSVSGNGSRWDMSGFMQLGSSGNGTLTIDGTGAVVSDTVGDMAVFGTATRARATVQNGGQWNNSDFLRIANSGTASLTIRTGGKVTSTFGLVASDVGSSGSILVDGGGSRWDNTADLLVGIHGSGTMTVSNGAVVTSTIGYAASDTSSTGSILVSGVGSQWNCGSFLSIGNLGMGSVNVRSGGIVSSVNAGIGDSAGGVGTVIVDGAGSAWNNTGFTSIGNSGAGTMLITNGGHVTNISLASVAAASLSVGRVTVTGTGSRWDLQAQIGVGGGGAGTMVISNGGLVTTKKAASQTGSAGIIGRFAAGSGTVLITGVGSRWDCLDGAMNVGFGSLNVSESPGGRGFLNVALGGVMTSTEGYIGRLPGGIGTAIIGDAGSQWTMTGSMFIGGDSTIAQPTAAGTLVVNAGGAVTIPAKLKVWNNGTVLYNGGTLSTGSIDVSGGGNVVLSVGGNKVLRTSLLTINTPTSSHVDLNDNDAIITASSYATVSGYIAAARNGGAWDRGGLTSTAARNRAPKSTTLGTLTGSEYRGIYGTTAIFNGFPVATTDTLVKYTWYGDTDFSGAVNFDDYSRTDGGFNNQRTGWLNGDFDYNGQIDFDDYSLIDLAFNTQSGTLRRASSYLDGGDRSDNGMNTPALRMVKEHYQRFGMVYATSFLNSVPEPATPLVFAGLAALAGSTHRSRVRRRRIRSTIK